MNESELAQENEMRKRKRASNFSHRSLEIIYKYVCENWAQYNHHVNKGASKSVRRTPRELLIKKIYTELVRIGEDDKTEDQIKRRIKDDIWRMKDSIVKRRARGEMFSGSTRRNRIPWMEKIEALLWNDDLSLSSVEDCQSKSSLLEGTSTTLMDGASIEEILHSLQGGSSRIETDRDQWLDVKTLEAPKPPTIIQIDEDSNDVEDFFGNNCQTSSAPIFEDQSTRSERIERTHSKPRHNEEICETQMKQLKAENEELKQEFEALKQRAYYQMGAHQDQILRLEAQIKDLQKETTRLKGLQK